MSAGRVCINGEVASELGTKVDPRVDIVTVDGKVIPYTNEHVVIMLNKPTGYITTMSDPYSRPCVASLVPTEEYPGLFPVGRLDADTSGLLLFTTDGDLGNRLMHPRHHVKKTYDVWAEGRVTDAAIDALRKGILLEDGMTLPAELQVINRSNARSHVEIRIREGRKRQVRRMFEEIGYPVIALKRIAVATLRLGALEEGTWRKLTEEERLSLSNDTTRKEK